jgi:DNA-directed RNA polymerase sigma subunit (sigma70/sigma32)
MKTKKITKAQFKKVKKNHTLKECAKILGLSTGQIYYRYSDIVKESQKEKREKLYNKIKKMALSGKLKTHIFQKCKVNTATVNKLIKEFGMIDFINNNCAERDKEIIECLSHNAITFAEVGRKFQLSRERIRQIFIKDLKKQNLVK